MAIVASAIIEDRVQKDGRRDVRERHTDHLGQQYFFTYLAAAGADVSATMTARVVTIEADLAAGELDANESQAFDQKTPTFNYSTVAQFRQRLRERFKDAAGWELVRLGKFVQGLGLSDAQLTNLFGVSGAQLTALKAKLAALRDKYDDAISQRGQ